MNASNHFATNGHQPIAKTNISLPAVAIVILNWNGKKWLQQFLPSVLATHYPNKRIIVADNASTDDSITFLQQHFPAVEIIQHSENEGFAKGYNSALKQVSSDYYVLLNSDVEVTPNWIDPLVSLMESDVNVAACQPKILAFHHNKQFEYAGASGGWIDRFGYPFMRGRIFDTCETDHGQYNQASPCFWASGAALFVRASIFHEMQGFDEHFFAHQEEIDLCWRMQLWGYKIWVQPASVVYHVGGGTLPKGNSRKVYLNYRNNLIMVARNWPLSQSWWKIPVRFSLDALAAWKELLGGDAGYFFAVIKAHFHALQWIIFGKRTQKLPAKRAAISAGQYRGSVVWEYFVNKRKTFSEIIKSK